MVTFINAAGKDSCQLMSCKTKHQRTHLYKTILYLTYNASLMESFVQMHIRMPLSQLRVGRHSRHQLRGSWSHIIEPAWLAGSTCNNYHTSQFTSLVIGATIYCCEPQERLHHHPATAPSTTLPTKATVGYKPPPLHCFIAKKE